MKKLLILALSCAIASSAHASAADSYTSIQLNQTQIEFVKKEVSDDLKDPESARFVGEFTAAANKSDPTQITVCGWVNGKNSYGAYSGKEPFFVSLGSAFSGSKDPHLALLTLIGGSTNTEVVVEMCRQTGLPQFR